MCIKFFVTDVTKKLGDTKKIKRVRPLEKQTAHNFILTGHNLELRGPKFYIFFSYVYNIQKHQLSLSVYGIG